MSDCLRVVVADDERPARLYLVAMLETLDGVSVVAQAADGAEAVRLIERERPDLALLDLQMPEVDGLGVVRLVAPEALPLVAFVTAYDEYAVRAFELNAIDYLLKPVERERLAETLHRARERAARRAASESELAAAPSAEDVALRRAFDTYEEKLAPAYLDRIPVRHKGEIVILPVGSIASVRADGELLRITARGAERPAIYTINYRLKDLEARLDPRRFVRLSRGTLANREMIQRVQPMPGGTYTVVLSDGQRLQTSRARSRTLRDDLLRL